MTRFNPAAALLATLLVALALAGCSNMSAGSSVAGGTSRSTDYMPGNCYPGATPACRGL